MRTLLDKIFRASIKMCLLTGVTFTVTACYGVRPTDRDWYNDPTYQSDTEQVDQQLAASNQSEDDA